MRESTSLKIELFFEITNNHSRQFQIILLLQLEIIIIIKSDDDDDYNYTNCKMLFSLTILRHFYHLKQ